MKYAALFVTFAALAMAGAADAQILELPGDPNEYNPNGMLLSHAVPGSYTSGERLEVVVQVDFVDRDGLTAVGVIEQIPHGWTFDGMGNLSTGVTPNIVPQVGASDVLGFAWITVQGAFPSRFSYFLRAAEKGHGAASIVGQGQYRTYGGELYSDVDTVVMQDKVEEDKPWCLFSCGGGTGEAGASSGDAVMVLLAVIGLLVWQGSRFRCNPVDGRNE
ncbi:hypothetical protein [Roseovarius pacificus]|uniref:hypothetical protein n=1 Tax=Roseovarius pacificus TaxID=337701 RepID=UPI002A18CD4F|nr:hypothetical protein [Roseovarius pacificus]